MKKVMIIFMVLGSLAITAQNKTIEKKKLNKELRENFTPEQRAELLSKKMTLDLDLTDLQQKEIKQLFLDLEKDKPTYSKIKKETTSEDKYKFKKTQMDRRITLKRELQKILSAEQFEKWEKRLSEKRAHQKKEFRHSKRNRQ